MKVHLRTNEQQQKTAHNVWAAKARTNSYHNSINNNLPWMMDRKQQIHYAMWRVWKIERNRRETKKRKHWIEHMYVHSLYSMYTLYSHLYMLKKCNLFVRHLEFWLECIYQTVHAYMHAMHEFLTKNHIALPGIKRCLQCMHCSCNCWWFVCTHLHRIRDKRNQFENFKIQYGCVSALCNVIQPYRVSQFFMRHLIGKRTSTR